VQSHPGQLIVTCGAAFVQRLMLMPDEGDVERIRHKTRKRPYRNKISRESS
jgi:hypothetical protein